MGSDFQYDVFISYSHNDRGWVMDSLIPYLKSFDASYAIDENDFKPGRSFEEEMVRLIKASRQVLAVLTPDWVQSNYGDFEGQVGRSMDPQSRSARLLPLVARPCKLPELFRETNVIDLTALGESNGWRKLHETLLEARLQVTNLLIAHAEMKLWRESHYNMYSGSDYEYHAAITIINSSQLPLVFDSVLLTASVPRAAPRRYGTVDAVRIVTAPGRVTIAYSDRGPAAFFETAESTGGEKYAPPQSISLKPRQGLKLPQLGLGALRQSIVGQEVTALSIYLSLGKHQVTHRCTGVLPPLTRLSESERDEGIPVSFVRDEILSFPSGILDPEVVRRIFEAAARYSEDSLLLQVTPLEATIYQLPDDRRWLKPHHWRYRFYSEKKGGFQINPDDPTWNEPDAQEPATRPKMWLSEYHLSECRIDAATASLIADHAKCAFGDNDFVDLEAVFLEGRWRPAWLVPMRFGADRAAVLADSGELIARSEDVWRKPPGIIWNI